MNGFWESIVSLIWYTFFFLVPAGALSLLVHFLLSLPLRRRERARFFLDLIETALTRGQPVEHAIVSAAATRDPVMGVRFYLVAAHLEGGLHLGAALEKVPRFLPPQISAMLCAGEKLGDLKRVLPACREILRDAPAAVRSAVHYMIALLLVFSPIAVFLISMMAILVIPKFKEVANGSGAGARLWPITRFVFDHSFVLVGFETVLFLLLVAAAFIYVGGPGVVRWFQFPRLPWADWIVWHTPWKQKYLQRTFSAMLAVLLDGGVPEAEAVRLAGDCTANEICRRRTRRVLAALERGTRLDDAVGEFDDTGEFHWRLTNAVHARGGFLAALRGWHEALDAKAFQQQEATAHAVTSGLVILNGVVVALIATAMFGVLIVILKGAAEL